MTNIELHDGIWFINGYFISGDKASGYVVFTDNNDDEDNCLYESDDFEKCLTWCYNS